MILVDSSFFIALATSKDRWHDRAESVRGKLTDKLVATDLVISETVTYIGSRAGGKAGHTMFNFFQDNCDIVYGDEDLFHDAIETFRKYDGRLSLADSMSVVVMGRMGIKRILSFDGDFDRVKGIERIY